MKFEKSASLLLFKKNPEAEKLLERIALETPPEWRLLINEDCPVPLPDRLIRSSPEELRESDLLLPLGGDGTVLSAARLAASNNIPILGIHLGRTGFLTDCPPEKLQEALFRFSIGKTEMQERATLSVKLLRNQKVIQEETILNEVQINPPISSHRFGQLVDLRVSLDGHYLTDYHADFLLVTTPTGSTGYNLSAGGPIVHPESKSIVLQAVNSPALSVRPLVLDDKAHLVITSNESKDYTVLLDGRITWQAESHDQLQVELSEQTARFVKLDDYTFVDALREKLGWSGHWQQKRGR
jgi:NAD+ kinase